jgi:hypothetical protein
MGARLYSPMTGRFLQVDPVFGGACNAYDYVCQDPVNGIDLNGTDYDPNGHGDCAQPNGTVGPCGNISWLDLLSIVVQVAGLFGPDETGTGEVADVIKEGAAASADSRAADLTVGDVLKGKLGYITKAKLPPGSPS